MPCRLRLLITLACVTSLVACAGGKTQSSDGLLAPDRRIVDAPQLLDGPTPDRRDPDGPTPDGPTPDTQKPDIRSVDTLQPDTYSPDLPPAPDVGPTGPNVGAPCSTTSDCKGGTQCLLNLGGVSICTMTCTTDNPKTTQNEDSCPNLAKNICGEVRLASGGTQNYCFQKCQPRSNGNDCPAELACDPTSGDVTGSSELAICGRPACKTNVDCNVFTAKTCTSTSAGCGTGETCVALSSGNRCARPGLCNTTSGMCEGHNQGVANVKIGAPCAADVDCGNDQFCLRESGTGAAVVWRGGYCTKLGCVHQNTVPKLACPSGSSCSRAYGAASGLCLKSCSLSDATTCRNRSGDFLGDYDCYAWDHYSIGGKPVATTPVCDLPIHCNFFTSGCSGLGLSPNSTNMTCRNKNNNVLASSTDPSGFCLDNSAAGPVQ